MKLASIQSRRDSITQALNYVRQNNLDLMAEVSKSSFFRQAHPEFSPIGWHFGHIAFTEAYWVLEYLANSSPSYPEYRRLFAADGLPKQERENLPNIETIREYLHCIRIKTLNYLANAPIEKQERLWRWLIQHESQHGETISLILQLHQQRNQINSVIAVSQAQSRSRLEDQTQALCSQYSDMEKIRAGEFLLGNNTIEAQDNERPAHKVYLNTYWIDRYPVTCGQYCQFMSAGGYQKSQYWSREGWQWLQQNPVSQPLYWSDCLDWIEHPVCGVSYYEAEAYANFAHKRLPTETEWEKAAQGTSHNCNHGRLIGHTSPVTAYAESSIYGCQDMLGNVWEWTTSWFEGYPDFRSYPYPGYSEVYFDHQHRVLRGGSWASSPATLRASFRNWYQPHVRQILTGFRCAQD